MTNPFPWMALCACRDVAGEASGAAAGFSCAGSWIGLRLADSDARVQSKQQAMKHSFPGSVNIMKRQLAR